MSSSSSQMPSSSSTSSSFKQLMQHPQALKILGCVVGVVGSLLVYGLLQERIMTRPYETDGENEEYFKFSVFLVLSNRLLSCLMAMGILAYSRGNVQPVAGIHRYCAVSLSKEVSWAKENNVRKVVEMTIDS